jgi:DNA-binding transcriptional LysR family regulator
MKMALCHNQLEYKPMPWTDRVKRRLKLRDLDFLAALIETGTMGKAAGRLHVSQPAVSKAIADLERTLGVRLVDRSRRGIVPTPYGVAMGKRIVAIFNDLRQGVQEIDFLSDPTKGEIRIGTTEPIAAAIVTPAIDRLSREYPQMIFHFVAGDTWSLYREVAERNVELAICRMIGRLPEELTAEILFYDAFVVATAATNPLTRRRKLTLEEIANEPWTLYPYDGAFGSIIAETFRANGYEPPRLTVPTLSAFLQNELLATGRFLTVLPGFMLKVPNRFPPLKALAVALPNNATPIGIITLKGRTVTPIAQTFIDNARAIAKPLVQSL